MTSSKKSFFHFLKIFFSVSAYIEMEKFWWKLSEKFRWNGLMDSKKSYQKSAFFCKILWFTWCAPGVSPEENAQPAWNTLCFSRVTQMCTPGVPGVYHVFFSGEDGDLTILDPYFCQKIVKNCQNLSKNLSKFVKICQNLSKFVKICQNLSKFVKNCPKGVPFFDHVYTFILPDLSIKYTKNTGVHTLCTPGLQKVSSHYVTLCVSAGNSIFHRGIKNFWWRWQFLIIFDNFW